MRTRTVLLLWLVNSWLTACTTAPKTYSPSQQFTTETGFQFRVPPTGEWAPGASSQEGLYVLNQKPRTPGANAATTVAVVRHGPIHTPGGKAMSNRELLDGFKHEIETEAKNGRVVNVRSTFTLKTYAGAECLSFNQTGEDHVEGKMLNITNGGLICLHPRRRYQFIWLGVSERRPAAAAVSLDYSEVKAQLLTSLQFI